MLKAERGAGKGEGLKCGSSGMKGTTTHIAWFSARGLLMGAGGVTGEKKRGYRTKIGSQAGTRAKEEKDERGELTKRLRCTQSLIRLRCRALEPLRASLRRGLESPPIVDIDRDALLHLYDLAQGRDDGFDHAGAGFGGEEGEFHEDGSGPADEERDPAFEEVLGWCAWRRWSILVEP